MINVLIIVAGYLFSNFGLAIIALTLIVRGATIPLTLKQLHATKAMQDLQPKLTELQKKYGKDKAKMAQEQMRLYKESGVSPAGCMLPMLVQMPIWIALFQSIIRILAVTPEDFLNLSGHLYSSWATVFSLVPLKSNFLWLDLATPDRFLMLPILVGGTMWLQQKMVMSKAADPRQQAQSQMMLWMMPIMFFFLASMFPSGLSLFWAASSVVRIVMQYRVTGLGGITREAAGEVDQDKKRLKFDAPAVGKSTDDVGADIVITDTQEKPSKMRYLPGKDRANRRRKK